MIWMHMVHMVHIWQTHTYMVNIVRIVQCGCTAHCTKNEIGNRLNGDFITE